MQGLLYGVRPEEWTPPDDSNRLLVGLSRTPMRLQELDEPKPIRDDWAVAKTRLTGICGSDAKMVFMDFGDDFGDGALNGFFSFPTVFGHEVVADVVEVGPAVTTLEVGQRVVLNPWLSCAPRGIDPVVPVVPGRVTTASATTSPRARSRPGSTPGPRRTRPAASPTTCRRTSRCSSPCPTT